MQYSSSLAGLTPELAELLLGHMARERLLRPRTLELFFGCPLQKLVLSSYSYSTNELLRQLRAFTALKHLSLVNSPLITGTRTPRGPLPVWVGREGWWLGLIHFLLIQFN